MEHQLAKLTADIDAEVASLFSGGKTNHLSDLGCSIGAILASSIAAILAALGSDAVSMWITAVVAALPGFFASLQRVVDFRGRAAWYFSKAAGLRDLTLNAKYGNLSMQEAAKQWGETEKKLEERWPEMVRVGASVEMPQGSATIK